MKNRNMFILIIAILLMVTFLASASALIMSGIKEETINVSVVIDDSGSGRWASFIAGMEQAAKDKGVKLNVVPTNKNLTINQQFNLIKEEINNGADGIILQVTNSRGTESIIADISSKVVLEMVDTSADTDLDVEGKSACIEADNVEIGRALANEVRIALGNDLTGYKIGIIEGNRKQRSIQQRLQGFTENIETSGAEIVWYEPTNINLVERIGYRQSQDEADIIVALDNGGLEAASEYAVKTGVSLYIFGEGTSIKNVSYLDDGIITSMVVPNEYSMGYQSLSAIAGRFENRLTPMQNELISFRVINRENLFDESNQRILFPVVQ
jgi:ribose transport system substrate-binding protein